MRPIDPDLTLRDLAELNGMRQGHRQMRRLADILWPARSGVKGEAVKVTIAEAWKAAVILELLDLGVDNEMAMVACAAIPMWLRADLSADRELGFLYFHKNTNGEIRQGGYLSRNNLDFTELTASDSEGRRPLGILLIDLSVITQKLLESIEKYENERDHAGKRLSVEEMVRALTNAARLRDEVEAAHSQK